MMAVTTGFSRVLTRDPVDLPAPRADWAYFLDIDGTLVDLDASPESVRVGIDSRAVIEKLFIRTGGAVALISGRSIKDVERVVFNTHIPAAGQHGVERRNAEGVIISMTENDGILERECQFLREIVAAHPGLVLEEKGFCVALHYRMVPHKAAHAHRIMKSACKRLGRNYEIQKGKAVVEIRRAGIDKGAAILSFLNEPPFNGRKPVFLGDDATDEHGFAVVNKMAGVSIKVGPGPTQASWRLRDVNAVRTWLELGT